MIDKLIDSSLEDILPEVCELHKIIDLWDSVMIRNNIQAVIKNGPCRIRRTQVGACLNLLKNYGETNIGNQYISQEKIEAIARLVHLVRPLLYKIGPCYA